MQNLEHRQPPAMMKINLYLEQSQQKPLGQVGGSPTSSRAHGGKFFGSKGAVGASSRPMSPKYQDGTPASPDPSTPVEGLEIPKLMAKQPAKASIVPNMVSIGVL